MDQSYIWARQPAEILRRPSGHHARRTQSARATIITSCSAGETEIYACHAVAVLSDLDLSGDADIAGVEGCVVLNFMM